MTGKGKMQELLERLARKTREKKINWSKSVPPGSFMTSLPRHSIKIGPTHTTLGTYDRLEQENFPLTLTVLDDVGEFIAATTGNAYAAPVNSEFVIPNDQLSELYQLIKASQPINTVLDELLQELA